MFKKGPFLRTVGRQSCTIGGIFQPSQPRGIMTFRTPGRSSVAPRGWPRCIRLNRPRVEMWKAVRQGLLSQPALGRSTLLILGTALTGAQAVQKSGLLLAFRWTTGKQL